MVRAEIREQFKKLYEEKFHIAITDEEATQMATDLINLVQVLVKPDVLPELTTSKEPERRNNALISLQSSQ